MLDRHVNFYKKKIVELGHKSPESGHVQHVSYGHLFGYIQPRRDVRSVISVLFIWRARATYLFDLS